MERFLLLGLLGLGVVLSAADTVSASPRQSQDSNRGDAQNDDNDRDIRSEPGYVRGIPIRGSGGGGSGTQQVMIESMFIVTDRSVFGVDMDIGVYRDSLHKFSGFQDIPLIGGLFGSKAPSGKLGPETEVGSAYTLGSNLVITIWPQVAPGSVRLEVVPDTLDDLIESLARKLDVDAPPVQVLPVTTLLTVDYPESLVVAHQDNSYEVKASRFQDLELDLDVTGMTLIESNLMRSQSTGEPIASDLSKVPLLGAIFRGGVYEGRDQSLVVVIEPTILEVDEN